MRISDWSSDVCSSDLFSSARGEENGYSFLVSGAYDFATGTLVTPRIIGELGLSYLAPGAAGRLAGSDPTVPLEVAPTARLGFGAAFELGDYLAVSAQYSPKYRGAPEISDKRRVGTGCSSTGKNA